MVGGTQTSASGQGRVGLRPSPKRAGVRMRILHVCMMVIHVDVKECRIRLFPSIRTWILHVCITNGWLHDDVTRTCHARVMHMLLTCLHESFPRILTLMLLLTMKCSLSTALKNATCSHHVIQRIARNGM